MNNKKVVLVVGAGDATGGAIAKRFAQEGFVACVTRRSADKLQPLVDAIKADGGEAHGFACDARKEEDVIALVEQIESRDRPNRSVRLQHRRQCALQHSRRNRPQVFQDLGNGLLLRVSQRS